MSENARMQRDIMTVQMDAVQTIETGISQNNGLHINMGIASILGTRQNQQDTVFGMVEGNRAIAIVCDGMGGMNGGERASQTAATLLADDYYKSQPIENVPEFLRQEAKKMDAAVFELTDDNGEPLNGGTTVVTVLIQNNCMHLLSVGDSRIYIIRDNQILPINREHNYRLTMDERLRKGEITEEEYKAEEGQAEALISYLGIGNVSLMDVNEKPFELMEDDIILLCSDGLYKRLSDTDILDIVRFDEPDMERAARRLTEVVTKRTIRNQDNTSLVLMQYCKY